MRAFGKVAVTVAWRTLHNIIVRPELLVPSLIFPLFFFTAFAGGLSGVDKVPGFDYPAGYTAFQFVFVFLQASAFSGVFTGFGIAADFESGISRRLLLAAPNRLAIIAGYALAALARVVLIGAILTVVALLAGMNVAGDAADLFGLLLLAALVCLAATLFAAGVATRMRTVQAGPLMQMPVFLILFLAPVYVPLNLVGGWVNGAAHVNPFTPIITAGRDLLAGRDADLLLAFGAALGLVAAFALWAVRGMRSAERAG